MREVFNFGVPIACVAAVALMAFGSWGTVVLVLVVIILLLGVVICFLFDGAMGLTNQAQRAAQLEPQLAEFEKQLAIANNTIKQQSRDYELNAQTWQQQLNKYAADVRALEAQLAEKEKRIEALQKGAPKIPKGDDDAIKKLFR